jgi:hypothetical protein
LRRKTMKTIILVELAVLVTASACGSARGATAADTGTTCSCPTRQQVKCYTETMLGDATVTSVTAECEGVEDVPLTGHCSRPGAGPEVLKESGPSGWDVPQGRAAWSCGWLSSTPGVAYVNIPGATAMICCLVKSQ